MRLELQDEQRKVVSDILVNLGNISLASVALPFLVPMTSVGALPAAILGTLLALLFWSLSVVVVKDLD